MKKQIKKLNISKRTISNLEASEMSKQLGGFNAGIRVDVAGKVPFSKRCNTSW